MRGCLGVSVRELVTIADRIKDPGQRQHHLHPGHRGTPDAPELQKRVTRRRAAISSPTEAADSIEVSDQVVPTAAVQLIVRASARGETTSITS